MKISLLVLIALLTVGCGGGSSSNSSENGNSQDDVSPNETSQYPYADSKGRIIYKTTITIDSSAPNGGSWDIDGTEEQVETFSNFGSVRKLETFSQSTGVVVIPGLQTFNTSTNDHEMSKIIDNVIYVVDFEKQEITRTDLTDLALGFNEYANVIEGGDTALYEETGTDNVLGYTCTEFKVFSPEGTTCFYRGIPLKTTVNRTEQTVDGTSTYVYEQLATKLELNIALDEDELDLPDYPVINGAQLNNDDNYTGTLHNINVSATPPSCPKGEGTVVVTNDVIDGSVTMDDSSYFTVTGEIGPDNSIYGGFVRSSVRIAEYTGQRSATGTLSGTWSSNENECYGTWSE